MFELNLILNAIAKTESEIKRKNLTKSQIRQLNSQLDLSPSEYVSFQETKSILQASGKISLETAVFIYNKLKNWQKNSIAEKYVLTVLLTHMLKIKQNL